MVGDEQNKSIHPYPNADLYEIEKGAFHKREFHEIDHFKLMRDFYIYPDGFMTGLLWDEEEYERHSAAN